MAGEDRRAPASQQAEPVVESRRDLLDRQHPGPRGRELEGQGDAVQLLADQPHRGSVVGGQGEGWLGGARPLDKEAHRLTLLQVVEGGEAAGAWERQ